MPTDSPAPDALLLDGPGVCRRLSIGLSLFHSMRRAGKLPLTPIRLSKAVRFSAAELAAWCAAGCPAAEKWRQINLNKSSK